MSVTSRRVSPFVLWGLSALAALGVGSAGAAKLFTSGEWDRLFQSWGYPLWFMVVIACLEMLGAVALLVPRVAWLGATLLAIVMLGAAATLIAHPGTHLFRGRHAPMTPATPLVWFAVLCGIAVVRWRQRPA